MPRSSRHRSHRSHKHSSRDERDRSESEEEASPRERRPREEEPGGSSRVSRDPDPEKRRSSNPSQVRELADASNGDVSVEHGKKRKERVEDSADTDRWNGGDEEEHLVDKRSKGEEFGHVDVEKSSKSKLSASDSKGRSSRRHDVLSEKNEESGGKVESTKRRSEKDSSRRESSSQYKDSKERDRERASDRDKKAQNSKRDRSDNVASRKHGSKSGSTEEEHPAKKDIEIIEWQVQDKLRNTELDKELEKRERRRRDDSGDKDKGPGDGRDSDDRRLSSRDDNMKNGSYKDERHKDGKYRDTYGDELDRDRKHRDDKRRDEHAPGDHTSDRSDNKSFRDEKMSSESRYRNSKLQESEYDGHPYVDDHGSKTKDNKGRKRFSEDNEDHSDLKARSAKEPREDLEKNASSRHDSRLDRPRSEYRHSDRVDSSPSNYRTKSSASSSAYAVKDQSRYSSKQVESARRESPSDERTRPSTASTGDRPTSRGRERFSESRSWEKFKPKDDIHSGELAETAASSKCDRTAKSDGRTSPQRLTEKSPSTSDRRFSDRSSTRRSFDMDVGQRSSSSVDGFRERDMPSAKPKDDRSQTEASNREPTPIRSSSVSRAGVHFSGSSPNHLPPPPPVRHGIDSPSVLGSYEDDNKIQLGDRRTHSRYKRNADLNPGRGHGNAWKSAPSWPSPMANGFVPFQHGPPPAGFHPAVQQFPAPPLFGVRPTMDMNPAGVGYHMHEAADRFSSHGRPFGWHNPMDESCPHLQMWDGSNGVFNNESHVYGRPEWDQHRHLMGGRAWEMNADMWKGQNGNTGMDPPVPPKEQEYTIHPNADEARGGQSVHQSRNEWGQLESLPAENVDIKRSIDKPPAKQVTESPSKSLSEKAPEPSKMRDDDNVNFFVNYLSKIDISHDLVNPGLYKKCMSLLGDQNSLSNTPKHEESENNKDVRETTGTNFILNSFFPTTTDTLFQRAMSLYRKQNERSRATLAASQHNSEGGKDSSQASDEENVRKVDGQISLGNSSLEHANNASDMEEGKSILRNTAVDHPGDAMEQQSDAIPDAVVFDNGSQTSEALMTECRVNLSRIPESTH